MICSQLKIAGLDVPGGRYGDHEFARPLGVGAPEMVWCLPNYIADAVLALEWTEISMLAQGSSVPKVFKRVKVVRETASDHPLKRYVVLSDARWDWHRKYIKENYNLRTASAQTELLEVGGTPIEIDPVRTAVLYAGSSLKGGKTPWTADELLDDVFVRLLKVKYTKLARSFGNYAPNDVQLDSPGNVALAHAMAAMGGLDVRINDDGDVELVDAMLGAERAGIEAWCPYSLRGLGFMKWIRLPNVAPTKVSVGYDAEIEIRSDGWLPAPAADGAQVVTDTQTWPTLDNVIKVTDRQLAVAGTPSTKAYQAPQGTFLPVDIWFRSVATDTVVPAVPVPPQVNWTRAYENLDYMRGLMEFWYVTGNTGGLEPSAAWHNRYRAMREHYLKTWRLSPAFARLCLPGSIRPVRARLLDPANQARQPSSVYMDFARRPSIRGVRDEKQFGWNIHNIPGTPMAQRVGAAKTYSDPSFPDDVVPLSQCTQSPVLVQCLDPVSGIFNFVFKKDVHDHAAEIVPALVQQLPTNDLDVVNRGAGIAYWEKAQLTGTQRVILIFSAVPAAAPLYYVDVTPNEALARLQHQVQVAPKGPAFQTRVGPALQTARIMHTDEDRAAIKAVFASDDRTFAQNLLQAFHPLNQDILKDYAQSVAAVLYAALLDHYEGTVQVGYTPDAMPLGSLQCVTHIVTARGRMYTRLDCRPVTPPIQPIHFMERGARAVIFRSPGSFQ